MSSYDNHRNVKLYLFFYKNHSSRVDSRAEWFEVQTASRTVVIDLFRFIPFLRIWPVTMGLYLKPEGLIDENEKKDTEGGLISICKLSKLFKLFKHLNTPLFALC